MSVLNGILRCAWASGRTCSVHDASHLTRLFSVNTKMMGRPEKLNNNYRAKDSGISQFSAGNEITIWRVFC